MSLVLWKPSDLDRPVRKRYTEEGKHKIEWSTFWSWERGIKNGEATIKDIYELVCSVRDEDRNECFGNAFPGNDEDSYSFRRDYLDACLVKNVKFSSKVSSWYDAHKELLQIIDEK